MTSTTAPPCSGSGSGSGNGSGRSVAIDVAKGVAIIMIVLGHVLRGLAAAHLVDAHTAWYAVTDKAVYLVHLTLFAFLSGLFVRRGVDRDGARAYVVRRTALLGWLLLVWTGIQGAVKLLAGAHLNTPTPPAALLRFWYPDGQLWFLWWLALASAATAVVQPWRSRVRAAVMLAVTSGVALALWGVPFLVIGLVGIQITPFFVLGALLGPFGYARLWADRTRTALVAVGGTATWLAVALWTDATPPTGEGLVSSPASIAWGVLGTLAGTAGILAASTYATHAATWLAYLGRRSLDIFLAHIIVASGVRVVLAAFGVRSPLVQVLVGTGVGVAGSAALAEMARRVGLTWLFTLPRVFDRALSQRYDGRVPSHRGPPTRKELSA